MSKKFTISLVVALVVTAISASSAFAWHVNGITLKAVCNTTIYAYDVSATIDQNSQYPNAAIKSITPSTFSGNTTGTQSVTVVIGWPNSSDTQTIKSTVSLDGKCVKPPVQTNCPEGTTKDDKASTSTMLVCIKTVTVTVNVPGPTVYVDKPVPGPTVTVNVPGPTVFVDKPVPGPTKTVVVVKKVYGTPHCLKGEKTIARGKGWVRCQVTKTKVIVRVVNAPKPAYTR